MASRPSPFVRQAYSSLRAFFWVGKRALEARPFFCIPRERSGWSFPCAKLTASVYALKFLLPTLDNADDPVRPLAVCFLRNFDSGLKPLKAAPLVPVRKQFSCLTGPLLRAFGSPAVSYQEKAKWRPRRIVSL